MYVDDLTEETLERLGIKLPPPIGKMGERLIALGRVFGALRGIDDKEALQILLQAQRYILKRITPEIEEDEPGHYLPPVSWTIEVVAKSFHLTPDDLKQRRKDVEAVEARQVAMYLLRMIGSYTLNEVGNALGGRSPATVSHSFQRVAKRLEVDLSFRETISGIRTILIGSEH